MTEEDILKQKLDLAVVSAECGFWRHRAGQMEIEIIQSRLASLRAAEKAKNEDAPGAGGDDSFQSLTRAL